VPGVPRPLIFLAAAFGLGCLLADGQGSGVEALRLGGLALGVLALAGRARAAWATAAVGAAAVALGAALAVTEFLDFASRDLRHRVAAWDGVPVEVRGIARGDAAARDGRLRLTIDAEEVRSGEGVVAVDGRVRVEVGGAGPLPRVVDADRVAVWVALRPTDWVDGRRDGAVARGYCKSVRLVSRSEGRAVLRRETARLRGWMRERLQAALPPGPERGLVLAMVLGDRSEIDEETDEQFRASGTYHVLALSGAQVALVAALVAGLLRRLGAGPIAEAVVSGALVWFYAGLVGGDVPIVRAALMTSAILLARAVDLAGESLNLLGLAALLLLLASPADVWDVGFELSFGATLGILVLTAPLARGLRPRPFRAEIALAASLAAQVVLAPVLAAQFHRLAPAALVLNLVAVPLSGAVLLLGLATAVLSPPVPLLGDLAWIAAFALRRTGDLGPLAPWLDVRVAGPALVVVAVHVAGLVQLGRGRRGRGLALLAVSHLGLLVGPPPAPADGRLHLDVLDVGQGDALLLRSPSGRAMLVDAGGSFDPRYDVGERKVAPALWALGVRRIDALVLTHAHPDHVGGARFLLHAFDVREVWEGPAAWPDRGWRRLNGELIQARVARRVLRRGHRFEWDGVTIRVLGPAPSGRPNRVRNEDSLVLAATLGDTTFLLPGDVEGAGEDALAVPRSLVVKVPHHGSRSSSRAPFVARAAPRVAIVSAGVRNPFGHPDVSVLARYAEAGSLVLRTDRDGTVSVATDGPAVWVRPSREAVERRIR